MTGCRRRGTLAARLVALGMALSLALAAILAGCDVPGTTTGATPTTSSQGTTGTSQTTPVSTPTKPYPVQVQDNVVYGPQVGETLDLCTPQGVNFLRSGIVFIHGGGWIEGDKAQYEGLCIAYAQQGFVVASVNYRLAPQHPWPAQIVDVQLAVRYLRSIASQLILDPTRLCAWGDSAGGHLATFLGVLHTIHPGDEAGLLTQYAPDVACVVDEFGYTDLTAPLTTKLQKLLLTDLLGSSNPASNPARFRDASPIFRITATSAPTYIIQGTSDVIVPPSQSQELYAALQHSGVSAQYITYDGGHEFAGLTATQENALVEGAFAFVAAHLSY